MRVGPTTPRPPGPDPTVTTDVDRSGLEGDVTNTLYAAGAPLAAKSYESLKSNGYKGF